MSSYQIVKTQHLVTFIPKNHKHTMIWIHGLAYYPDSNIKELTQALGDHLSTVKVVIPCAPVRFVTVLEKETRSWFDIKFRGKKSFEVPFDQAFSSAEVFDSYQRVLKPIIDKEKQILNKNQEKGLLIVSGFSQGCGLSLHCLYQSENVDCALGVSGYLFPITKFDPQVKKPKRIIYGLSDQLRPWQFTKMTYEGKIPEDQFRLIPGMGHELNENTVNEMKLFLKQIFKE